MKGDALSILGCRASSGPTPPPGKLAPHKNKQNKHLGHPQRPTTPPPKKMRADRFQLAAGEAPGRAAYALGNGSQLKRTSPCSYPTMLRKNSPYSPSSSPLKPRPGRVQKPPQRCSTERDHRNVGREWGISTCVGTTCTWMHLPACSHMFG